MNVLIYMMELRRIVGAAPQTEIPFNSYTWRRRDIFISPSLTLKPLPLSTLYKETWICL